jgi:hypothetical protein
MPLFPGQPLFAVGNLSSQGNIRQPRKEFIEQSTTVPLLKALLIHDEGISS